METLKRPQILAAYPSKSGNSFNVIIGDELYNIPPKIMERVARRQITEVKFKEDGTVGKFTVFKPVDFTEEIADLKEKLTLRKLKRELASLED